MITNIITHKKYIGQTANQPNIRWCSHKAMGRKYKKLVETNKLPNDKTAYLYRSMAEHGISNFTFEVIREVPDEKLDDAEIELIALHNTLAPNGYNLTTGGGHFKHHDDTKQIISEKAKEAAPNLINKYRSDEMKGSDMYIVKHDKHTKGRHYYGVAINKHPLCSYKSFLVSDYGTFEKCKEEAHKFLAELVEKGEPYQVKRKKDPTLENGITAFRTGYKVFIKINGELYKKTFEGKNIPDEVKKQKAKDYIKQLRENAKKEERSETK